MGRRSWAVAMVASLLLVVAGPAGAQDASSRVSFDGLGFSFDHSLGYSVNVTQVPGQPPNGQQLGEPDPPHLVFSLYGRRAEDKRAPRVWDAPGVVRFYRTDDLAAYQYASQELDALRSLLADRPDLASRMVVGSDGIPEPMPYLPIADAGQAIIARAQYIDTPELAGVVYLTAFRQDVSPFAAGDFWYTFQGLSTDGEWYVAVSWIIDAGMFPRTVKASDANRIGASIQRYIKYLRTSLASLNGAAPDAFDPPLTAVDALVRSITFEDTTTTGPSATPSATPSASPSAVQSATAP